MTKHVNFKVSGNREMCTERIDTLETSVRELIMQNGMLTIKITATFDIDKTSLANFNKVI